LRVFSKRFVLNPGEKNSEYAPAVRGVCSGGDGAGGRDAARGDCEGR
jgi:hypothetical protein